MNTVAVVLGLMLTATVSQASTRPGLAGSGHPGRVAAAGLPARGQTTAAAVRTLVGAIPGVTRTARYHWPYASGGGAGTLAVTGKPLPLGSRAPSSARLAHLRQADVLVVGGKPLPARLIARLRGLPGVVAAIPVDAGRLRVNGVFVNVLGVSPSSFRPFAARPTARSGALWRNVAAGGMAISYTMGRLDKLSLAKPVKVTGARELSMPVAGFGTVGIGGVDAVVSLATARSLGLPARNAIVISAPQARLDHLIAKIKKLAPAGTAAAALVTQVIAGGTAVIASGSAGAAGAGGPGLTALELAKFLVAAKSRLGLPYVWGAAGPTSFDCSGLVQWSMAQAGVAMPRVAADQARTGPLVPVKDLQPGDLLFYHTDPTAPDYIAHVAIYIGNGQMLQAPEPGMNVEIVTADFGAGFAGAVRVEPAMAAAVAGNPAG
ncbi:MAG: C40 family peptidase [Streptosporangiaceae bacterium]